MRNFRDLDIWKEARVLVKEIYTLTETLPEYEKFGLISQINRCTISIASNIAEGCAKSSNKDFCRFLEISLGSCYELETQLLLCSDLEFVSLEIVETKIIFIQNTVLIVLLIIKIKSTTLQIPENTKKCIRTF